MIGNINLDMETIGRIQELFLEVMRDMFVKNAIKQ